MIENAFVGSKKYFGLLAGLGFFIALGALGYYQQLTTGLGITGMGRDVSWGFYIARGGGFHVSALYRCRFGAAGPAFQYH